MGVRNLCTQGWVELPPFGCIHIFKFSIYDYDHIHCMIVFAWIINKLLLSRAGK